MKHTVRMLRTVPGSYDGYTPMTWHRGQIYDDITDELLRCFVELGACELVEEIETKPAPQPRRGRPRRDDV